MNWKQVVATAVGTIWLTAVLVAWFLTGAIVNSHGYWSVMWAPAMFIAAAPFFIAALAMEKIK